MGILGLECLFCGIVILGIWGMVGMLDLERLVFEARIVGILGLRFWG